MTGSHNVVRMIINDQGTFHSVPIICRKGIKMLQIRRQIEWFPQHSHPRLSKTSPHQG